jgi:hypothetical protein
MIVRSGMFMTPRFPAELRHHSPMGLAAAPPVLIHDGDGYALYAQARRRRALHTCLAAVEPRVTLRGCFRRQGRALEVTYVDQQCGPGHSRLLGVTGPHVARLNLAVGLRPRRADRVHLWRLPRAVGPAGGHAFAVGRELAGLSVRLTAYDSAGKRLAQRNMGPFPIAQCAAPPVR